MDTHDLFSTPRARSTHATNAILRTRRRKGKRETEEGARCGTDDELSRTVLGNQGVDPRVQEVAGAALSPADQTSGKPAWRTDEPILRTRGLFRSRIEYGFAGSCCALGDAEVVKKCPDAVKHPVCRGRKHGVSMAESISSQPRRPKPRASCAPCLRRDKFGPMAWWRQRRCPSVAPNGGAATGGERLAPLPCYWRKAANAGGPGAEPVVPPKPGGRKPIAQGFIPGNKSTTSRKSRQGRQTPGHVPSFFRPCGAGASPGPGFPPLKRWARIGRP
jgi:hypothetical protein